MYPAPLIPIAAFFACFGVALWAFWWGRTARHAIIWGAVVAALPAFILAPVFYFLMMLPLSTPWWDWFMSDLQFLSALGLFAALLAAAVSPVAALLGLAASRLLFPAGVGRAADDSLSMAAARVGCRLSPLKVGAIVAGCVLLLGMIGYGLGTRENVAAASGRILRRGGDADPAIMNTGWGVVWGAVVGVAVELALAGVDLRRRVEKAPAGPRGEAAR